jgi:ribonuclease BN (tRNA processing enzyme)
MNLHILGSNSFGNCYILETATEALILEAGVRMSNVKKALRWQIKKVVGAVVTHEHNDHAGHVAEMVASGVMVLALKEVFSTHGLDGKPFTKVIEGGRGYKLGNFKILALPVKHDVPCLGYLITHPDMGRLLFVTDTVTFDYIVPDLNTIMIEANYADDIVAENIANGEMPEAMRPRLINSHMEIGQTKAILADADLSEVGNIVLIHLSDGNADEQRFVREVQEQTGKVVYAANAGMTIDISLKPY